MSLLFLCTVVSFFSVSCAALRPLSHSPYLQDSNSSSALFLLFMPLSHLSYFWFCCLNVFLQGWMGKVFSVQWADTLQRTQLMWCQDRVPPPHHVPPAPPHNAQAQEVTLLIARPSPQQAADAMPWHRPKVPTLLASPQVSVLKSTCDCSCAIIYL